MARHRGHGLLKAVTNVAQPSKHRVASRPNPWPRCTVCQRHVPTMCGECITRCPGCCLGHDEDDE